MGKRSWATKEVMDIVKPVKDVGPIHEWSEETDDDNNNSNDNDNFLKKLMKDLTLSQPWTSEGWSEDESSMVFPNVGILTHHYTTSKRRRQRLESWRTYFTNDPIKEILQNHHLKINLYVQKIEWSVKITWKTGNFIISWVTISFSKRTAPWN
jgi:hypothetical protein